MPATRSDFSTTSDKTVLGFAALAVFELLQPLTEGPSPELPPALLPGKGEMEGTCNLTLGETLPHLSTGTVKINTKLKVPQSCFKASKVKVLVLQKFGPCD